MPTAPSSTARQSLNSLFATELKKAAKSKLTYAPYVITYIGSELSLWHKKPNDEKYSRLYCEEPTSDSRYVALKESCHYAVLLTTLFDQGIATKNLEEVRKKLHEVDLLLIEVATQQSLSDIGGNANIISETRDAIKQSLAAPIDIWVGIKADYLRKVNPHLMENSRLATKIQIDNLHGLMKNWGMLDPKNLERSRTVLVSPHGPKIGRIEAQYFERMYQYTLKAERVEDNWMYHLENSSANINDILDSMLPEYEMLKDIGDSHLGGTDGMFIDVLANYAAPVLDQIMPIASVKVIQMPLPATTNPSGGDEDLEDGSVFNCCALS